MICIASKGHFLTQIPQPIFEIHQSTIGQDENTYFARQERRKLIWESSIHIYYLPIHNGSEMNAILLFGPTSIQSFPSFTTGQDFLHSWTHFLGLHRSVLTMAIRVMDSLPSSFFLLLLFLGGIFY
jgi:hypothetical protein